MKRYFVLTLLILLIVSMSGIAYSKDWETIDISEIHEGDELYGLTVFQGVTKSKFKVKVLGKIMNSYGVNRTYILAEFSDENGVLDLARPYQGMSGSPVFKEGKIVGAVSITYSESLRALGLITPIGEMLPFIDEVKDSTETEPFQMVPFDPKTIAELKKDNEFDRIARKFKKTPVLKGEYGDMVPVGTPIYSSGLHPEVVQFLREGMKEYGFELYSGMGTGVPGEIAENISKDLEPGDAVGIQLVRGDISISASGTVSYRKGNKVLIFGHPFYSLGPCSYPMTKEYVNVVMPSRYISFRLSSTLFPVGRIFDDRDTAVAGELGVEVPMTPVKVKIKSSEGIENFNYEVFQDKLFFPNMVGTVILESFNRYLYSYKESSMVYDVKVRVKNKRTGQIDTVKISNMAAGTAIQVLYDGLWDVMRTVSSLIGNSFTEVELLGIDVDMELIPNINFVTMEKAQLLTNPNRIKKGDDVDFMVEMKNYMGESFKQKISVHIPENLRTSYIMIGFANAYYAQYMSNPYRYGYYGSGASGATYDEMIENLSMIQNMNYLVTWVSIPGYGLKVDDVEFNNLPSSMYYLLGGRKEYGSNVSYSYNSKKQYFKTNKVISGALSMPVLVDISD